MNNDFIEVYDNILSSSSCKSIIENFENTDDSLKTRNTSLTKAKKISTNLHLNFSDLNYEYFNYEIIRGVSYCLLSYKQKYSYLNQQAKWNINHRYNIQKYHDGEGYYTLHHEHSQLHPYRMMVWMVYLNNAKCGTFFQQQNKTIDALEGRIVIWPAGWTHAHNGVTPNIGIKYIATGWFSYKPEYENGNLKIYGIDK
jgi:hypothetical protein